jgi:hypothetical protein
MLYFNSVDQLIAFSAQLDTKTNVSDLLSGDKAIRISVGKKDNDVEDLRDFLSSSN